MVNDWNMTLIGDVFEFKNGLNKGKEFFGFGTPIINYTDVYKNRSLNKSDIKGKVSLDTDEIKRFEAKQYDVFFTRTSETPDEVGMSSVLLEDIECCVFSGFVLRARPKNQTLLPRYCKYCFSTPDIRSKIILGCTYTTRALTNGKQLSAISIPVPPISEQERIAETLSDVDDLISSLEKLIVKKKAVKQCAMQELLTRKKRLASFDDNWETLSLAEIGAITGSGVDKKILPDEQPITLLNYTNVYHQVSISRKDLNHQVTASAEKIKNCSVLRGDVFLTPTSETPEEIATSAVASEDMLDVVYSYHVVRLRPNTCYNGAFINYALSTPMFREQAVQFAEGSGIRYVITLKKFKEMQLCIPTDKSEQDAIVSILSDMDNEIDSLEQKLAKTRQIKHGMMQQLLTGKIRLV